MRKVDPELLRLFGVRYVIADASLPPPAELVQTQSVEGDPTNLRLYQFADVNTGNYSPTELVPAADAATALKFLGSGRNFQRAVAVENPPAEQLVPASSVRIFAERGGLRLAASAVGTSLIVLPFEYSNCLTLERMSTDGAPPRLLRVDLLLTGVLFSGRLETNLRYYTGPFQNNRCRLADAEDFRRLGGALVPRP
jgi:hypothetical protein